MDDDPRYTVSAGTDQHMGAHVVGDGVNFAVFSAHAEKVELCLFDRKGEREVARIPLPEKSGDIWHGHVAGLGAGTLYGYRAHGPYAPLQGHRFNPHKLLLDPYTQGLHGSIQQGRQILGYNAKAKEKDLTLNRLDSAAFVPKSVVPEPLTPYPRERRPQLPWTDSIIYEAHVKGLTMEMPGVPGELRGTYEGLGTDAVLEHLTGLGVTALELLPIHAFLDEGFLLAKNLRNYWGYNSIAFFAPEPRYFGPNGAAGLRTAIERLHGAGIEVILDVVYNHSAEGNETGPTLCFRGLDNASYYTLLDDNPRYYANDTGTGNTVNVRHPRVLQLVIDSLRHWVQAYGIDGFRFDLATTLGREAHGFDRDGGFFDALRQDPLLKSVKLIAEPWDIGPGGYQVGGFPYPFAEWNDSFRDNARRFWRGDQGSAADIAQSLLGTAQKFDHSGRASWSSVNFLTAHDGFTLADVTSYCEKHNEANGEDNADGHNDNHADNLGAEGPTEDADINRRRAQRRRNMLATLFLSQGTPMLLGGDEIGNSQGGNNNAYCQDNPIGWINWAVQDKDLLEFTRKLIAFRKAHPVLTQKPFLHGKTSEEGLPDVTWATLEGADPPWEDAGFRTFVLTVGMAGDAPDYGHCGDRLIVVVNGEARDAVFALPEPAPGKGWQRAIDTADPAPAEAPVVFGGFPLIMAESLVVFAPVTAEGGAA